MVPEELNVKPVTPDQPRQEGQAPKKPRAAARRPKGSPAVSETQLEESERRSELGLAEPDLGGTVHATV